MMDNYNDDMPVITSGGVFGSINSDLNKNKIIIDDSTVAIKETAPATKKKRKKKSDSNNDNSTLISIDNNNDDAERLSGEVEDRPTSYSYMETNMMLHDAIAEIDNIKSQVGDEFMKIKNSRTMKSKYKTLTDLGEVMGSLMNAKLAAIREINSTISKSNDLDYKKLKDLRNAAIEQDDDKYISDLYQSYIQQQPQVLPPEVSMPPIDPAFVNSGVIRAEINTPIIGENTSIPVNTDNLDIGYKNYMYNMSPETRLMMYEGNPNIKQCVIFDAQSGHKEFKMIDTSTNTPIEGLPVYDQMFMEDTTLDLKSGIARNINLNETFPIIVVNSDDIKSEY